MNTLFNPEGPFVRFLTLVTTLVGLNLLTLVFCIPIVTAGPAIAAMHYIIIQIREGTESHIASTFWKQFKGNIKTGIPVGLILTALTVFIIMDFRIVNETGVIPKIFLVPIYVFMFILAAVAMFAFPLVAKFNNTVISTLKNAALLALANFPKTVTMILIYAIILFYSTQKFEFLPIFILGGLTLPSFISSYLYWPVLKNLIPEE